MVSIVKRLTSNVSQSERRPTAQEETLYMKPSPNRGSLLGAPILDLKKFATINSAIKAQRTTHFQGSREIEKLTFPNITEQSILSSPRAKSIWKTPCKNRKAGTSGQGLDAGLGIILTPSKPVFDDSAKAFPVVRSGILSNAVLSRRNSCVASVHGCDFESSHHRRFSSTEIQISDQLPLTKLLGAGGFGSVYMAILGSKKVAIKKFHAKTKNEKAKAESFQAESKAKTLRHPNIVRIFGTSSKENIDCVIMEYTGDRNLQQILNEMESPLEMSRRINYILDVVSALRFIHDNNLVHLDVKPANILVTPYDTCKLGDFGCCQVIENGTGRASPTNRSYMTGTFAYRAPELLRGEPPTMKADIYSFGVTLWQMSSGEQPYSGQNQHVVVFGVVAYNLRPQSSRDGGDVKNSREQHYRSVYGKCWDASPAIRPSAVALHDLFEKRRKDYIFE